MQFLSQELELAFSRFLLARTGGEEFCIILPGLNNEQAFTLLDKFKSLLSNMTIDIDNEPVNITVSTSVSNILHNSLDQQLQYADQLLYRAKDAGRNIVIGDEEEQ